MHEVSQIGLNGPEFPLPRLHPPGADSLGTEAAGAGSPLTQTPPPLFEDWEGVVAACHEWARWHKTKIVQAGWETEDFIHSHFLLLRSTPLEAITNGKLRSAGQDQLRATNVLREQIRGRIRRSLARKEFATWLCPKTGHQMVGLLRPEANAPSPEPWVAPTGTYGEKLDLADVAAELTLAVGPDATLSVLLNNLLETFAQPLALLWLCQVLYLHEIKQGQVCLSPFTLDLLEGEAAEALAARLGEALLELSERQRSVFLYSVTLLVWQMLDEVKFNWFVALPAETSPAIRHLFACVPLSPLHIATRVGCQPGQIREYRYRALKHLEKLLLS